MESDPSSEKPDHFEKVTSFQCSKLLSNVLLFLLVFFSHFCFKQWAISWSLGILFWDNMTPLLARKSQLFFVFLECIADLMKLLQKSYFYASEISAYMLRKVQKNFGELTKFWLKFYNGCKWESFFKKIQASRNNQTILLANWWHILGRTPRYAEIFRYSISFAYKFMENAERLIFSFFPNVFIFMSVIKTISHWN